MATIVASVAEVVILRILAALGVGLATGAAGEAALEAARKRQQEADKAKAAPIARADPVTKAREKCKDCPPDRGALMPVNHSMSDNSREYQARITGFPPGMEWKFAGKDFDGFKSALCLLQEAKAACDQFFGKNGKFRYPFQESIFLKMGEQAETQALIVRSNAPATLTYYFQTPLAYSYMKTQLLVLGITLLYAP
ncbi:Tox-REase-5 domain-containing protein [Rugamonas aquatica]|uniref:Tox-REase-5 domain-containing protein n=1 Tax=Rugamonas aquatica TaxID=2743357 RepID=A0A6A7N7B0_9BURK|nr:Tox-REase-5 domain-containing protein [Rugamonas aquatica]MQA40677.1 hypothetical protein [Rugamonas aquatica]